jgi:hypothetical protein
MRLLGSLLLATTTLIASAFAVACEPPPQSAPTQGKETLQPAKEKNAGKDTSCLGKARLAFDDAACNTCMSEAGCCAATIACFDGNEDCAALHSCMLACGDDGAPAPGEDAPDEPGSAEGLAAFTANVYPALKTSCGACHVGGTGGAPTFLAGDAAATRTLFKGTGWDVPNSTFVTKGQHAGPPLTAAQKTAIEAWVAIEAGSTGAGSGSGAGAGSGNGTGVKAACKAECKTKHPSSIAKWQTYNTCAAVTCKAECL